MTLQVNVSGRLAHEQGCWRIAREKPKPWRCDCGPLDEPAPREPIVAARRAILPKLNPGYLVACPACKAVRPDRQNRR